LPNLASSANVRFSSTAWNALGHLIKPPNPQYLSLHAALAKILRLRAMAEHRLKMQRDIEHVDVLLSNGSSDLGWLLGSRLSGIGHRYKFKIRRPTKT
jgi:hypothetical protein